MKNILLLTMKELKDYFISPIAYITISIFLILAGLIFGLNFFSNNNADLVNFFEIVSALLIIFISAICMGTWSEEKKSGTLEIIATQPFKDLEIVLSKIISSFLLTFIMIFLTFPIPVIVNLVGNPDNGIIIASYIGTLLLSISYILISHFISINTNNQIISIILSIVIIGIFYIISEPAFLEMTSDNISIILESIGISSHFEAIAKGVIDSRDLLYFTSLSIIFFLLTFKSFERIKIKGD